MNVVDVQRLRPHPKNADYFSDVAGEKYEEIKRSIEASGIRDPLKVLPDYTVIAGHQRLRIARELGLSQVPVTVCDVSPEEAEYLLIADNEERRGTDEDPMRKARRAKFLKEYWGVKHGNNQRTSQNDKSYRDVAEAVGESVPTTQRLLKLNDLIEPFQTLISSGRLTQGAGEQLAYLTPDTQRILYATLGDEIGQTKVAEIKTLRAQLEEAQDRDRETARLQQELSALKEAGRSEDQVKIRALEAEIQALQNRPPEKVEVVPDAVQQELRVWKDRVSELEAVRRQLAEEAQKAKESLAFWEKESDGLRREANNLAKKLEVFEKGATPLPTPEEREWQKLQQQREEINAQSERNQAIIRLSGNPALLGIKDEETLERTFEQLIELYRDRRSAEHTLRNWEHAAKVMTTLATKLRRRLQGLEVIQ